MRMPLIVDSFTAQARARSPRVVTDMRGQLHRPGEVTEVGALGSDMNTVAKLVSMAAGSPERQVGLDTDRATSSPSVYQPLVFRSTCSPSTRRRC